jgi:serine/threonine protein kinase
LVRKERSKALIFVLEYLVFNSHTENSRYTIALDLGSAILYLHTECEQCVVHGDIKTSNGMLDSLLQAKLGDFGLARLVDHGAEPQTTQVVAGTVGYIDPEFVATRRPSVESDIYSFGVVLLEIASGKQPTAAPAGHDAPALLRRVRDTYNRNSILDAADQRLNGQFDRQQMERVLVTGLWCAHRDRAQRPSIAQAMADDLGSLWIWSEFMACKNKLSGTCRSIRRVHPLPPRIIRRRTRAIWAQRNDTGTLKRVL